LIIAQQAFIEELQSKVIKLGYEDETDKGILLDGEAGEIKSYNYKAGESGFLMRRNKVGGIQSEFTDVKAVNMKVVNMEVTGNLNANVSLNGTDAFPLYGGVRAKIDLTYMTVSNDVTFYFKTPNVIGIKRISKGVYRLQVFIEFNVESAFYAEQLTVFIIMALIKNFG